MSIRYFTQRLYEYRNACNYAASVPTLASSTKDGYTPQGDEVHLTCKVTYSGTNLMPLYVDWYRSYPTRSRPYSYEVVDVRNVVNSSSVLQSSQTFLATGQTLDTYWCKVWVARPTGRVLPGVKYQDWHRPYDRFYSLPLALRTIASETVVYMYTASQNFHFECTDFNSLAFLSKSCSCH